MAAEIIRPDADDSNPGAWTDDLGGTSNIYLAIDESTASDTDYVKTPNNPVNAIYVVRFANPGTTPTSYHGRLSYRYRKQGARTADLRVQLLQGGTVVQEWSHANIGTSWVQADQLIVAEITDWDAITVEFKGNQSSGGATTTVEVSWTEITTSEVKTIKATGGDYTTISNWNTNLTNTTYTTAGTVAEGHLFNESYTESGVTISPSASNLKGVVLTVRAGERHDGTANSGANIQASANRFGATIALWSSALHEAVFWLDIDGNAATIGTGISIGTSVSYSHAVMRSLIHDMTHDQNSASRAIAISNSLSAVVANNFIWSIKNTNAAAVNCHGIQNNATLSTSTEFICNNSVWDVDSTNGIGYGIAYRDSASQRIQNNVVAACDNDYDPHTTTNCTANTNASTDSGGPALFAGDPVVASTEFKSLSGTIDLGLKTGAECIDAGTALTVPYQARRDIHNDIRTGTWDIGADEFVVVVSSSSTTTSSGAELFVFPDPVVANWSVVTPNILKTILPDTITANWSPVTPNILKTIAPDPTLAAWSTVDPTLFKTISPDAISALWSVVAPNILKTISPDSLIASWAVPNITVTVFASSSSSTSTSTSISSGAEITLLIDPLSIQWLIPALNILKTISPTPIEVAWSVPNFTILKTVKPDPVSAQWGFAAPTILKTISPDALAANWNAVAPTVLKTVSPDVLTANWAIVDPTLLKRLSLDPVVANWSVIEPFIQAPIILSIDPLVLQWLIPDFNIQVGLPPGSSEQDDTIGRTVYAALFKLLKDNL